MARKFVIPSGKLLTAHLSATAIPGDFRRADYEMVKSSREAIYTDDDVCVNAETKECNSVATMYGVEHSAYVEDGEFWGFRLPPNSRGVSFILVDARDVVIREITDDRITPEQIKRMSDWVKEVVPTKNYGFYQDAADAFLDMMKDEQDRMAAEIAKQVDEEIMKHVPPIYGAPTA